MDDALQSRCVHSARPVINRRRYELAIYTVNDFYYYAAWYCSQCMKREETPRFASQLLASHAAEDAMHEHGDTAHNASEAL